MKVNFEISWKNIFRIAFVAGILSAGYCYYSDYTTATDFKRIIEIEKQIIDDYKAQKYCVLDGCIPESAPALMKERGALIEKYPEFKEKFNDFSRWDPETYK